MPPSPAEKRETRGGGPSLSKLSSSVSPYFGGGGTRHETLVTFPDVSVTTRTASPLSLSLETITPGPGRVSLGRAPGACVIFTLSPFANGSETNELPLSYTRIEASPTRSDPNSW